VHCHTEEKSYFGMCSCSLIMRLINCRSFFSNLATIVFRASRYWMTTAFIVFIDFLSSRKRLYYLNNAILLKSHLP